MTTKPDDTTDETTTAPETPKEDVTALEVRRLLVEAENEKIRLEIEREKVKLQAAQAAAGEKATPLNDPTVGPDHVRNQPGTIAYEHHRKIRERDEKTRALMSASAELDAQRMRNGGLTDAEKAQSVKDMEAHQQRMRARNAERDAARQKDHEEWLASLPRADRERIMADEARTAEKLAQRQLRDQKTAELTGKAPLR